MRGQFRWGPLYERVTIDSEDTLRKTFWKPNNTVANVWFTSANFLSYSNNLLTVRVGDDDNANTALRVKNATAANSNGFLVKNDDHYENNYADGTLQATHGTGNWIAKFAGSLGNSLKVSTCSEANTYESTLTGTLTVVANSATVSGSSTQFTTQVSVGDLLVINSETHMVSAVTNATSLTLRTRHVAGAASNTVTRRWEHFFSVNRAPGTSTYASQRSGLYDEMHIVVVDKDGEFTGTANTVLEVFESVSKAADAKLDNGETNYYKNVINNSSKYIRWAGHNSAITNAGQDAKSVNFGGQYLPLNYSLSGGNDGTTVGNSHKYRGYNLFKDGTAVDVSLILGADANQAVATHIINNIVESRKDAIALLSPPRTTVVNNEGDEATDAIAFRNTLPSSSYFAIDSGWKWQYDPYNDVYRYVPLNGDTAGLIAQTDLQFDPWYSPAGFSRGNVKNVIKLAYNPNKTDRDNLYKAGINPVVTFPGMGTVLYGDKTGLAKPSAFDRINVRRLFIVLEKAIATASQFTLFNFNDEFTRSQFKAMVEPFLRNVQGRRGIIDFRVVCDESNNTPDVIDRNEFVGDIYIKPARSINFINLRFVAVRTGVEFDEIAGRF